MHAYTNNNNNIFAIQRLRNAATISFIRSNRYLQAQYAAIQDPRLWFKIKAKTLKLFNPFHWVLPLICCAILVIGSAVGQDARIFFEYTLDDILTGACGVSLGGFLVSFISMVSLAFHPRNSEFYILLDDIEGLVALHDNSIENLLSMRISARSFLGRESDAKYSIMHMANAIGSTRIYRALQAYDALDKKHERVIMFEALHTSTGLESGKIKPMPKEIILKILSYVHGELMPAPTLFERIMNPLAYRNMFRIVAKDAFADTKVVADLIKKAPVVNMTKQYNLFCIMKEEKAPRLLDSQIETIHDTHNEERKLRVRNTRNVMPSA